MMRIETTFFLDTTRENFDSWLVRTWTKAITIPTAAGGEHCLQRARRTGDKVTIDHWYGTPPNADDESTSYPYGWAIAFEAIPLDAKSERIEVRGTCTSEIAESAFYELLTLIASSWPESGLALALDPPAAVIDGEESTTAPVIANKPNPLSKWNPVSIQIIERMSNEEATIAMIRHEVSESESTIKRIRAELARQERIVINQRSVKVNP